MNLDRRIKRRLLASTHRGLVQPGPGCTSAVEEELEVLLDGLVTPGGVRATRKTTSDGVLLSSIRYRPLLELAIRLTTAQDISLLIGEGAVHNRQDLAALLETIDWQFFLHDGDSAYLRCDSHASTLYHEGLIREVVAVRLERLRVRIVKGDGAEGARTVFVRIERNRCRVFVSLAGTPLWKRGYRDSTYAPAPLREDLAQSAIRTTLEVSKPQSVDRSDAGARRRQADVLFVPFSGSGTLLFEFLIERFRIPPFVFRESYDFEHFPVPPPPSVVWVKDRLLDSMVAGLSTWAPLEARLVDRDRRASAAAEKNLRRFESLLTAALPVPLRLPLTVESTAADVFARPWRSWLPEGTRRVFLPMNPPYGVRLTTQSVAELYRRIGTAAAELAGVLPRGGLRGFILCPSERSWRAFLGAVRPLDVSTSHFSQGGLDIRLCSFRS